MSQKNKLIINCGTTQVSAGVFNVSGGRLILEKFEIRDLQYDYGHSEAWLAALNVALKSMNLSGKADVIVPTASLLTKSIKVAHVEGKAQRDANVSFEAEKNIPYPLNEVSWDYQVISDDGIETEILLVSMKASVADDFCAAVTVGGIVPVCLQASSTLDYNSWRYCGIEENVMILNVGAKASNLIIARDSGLFVRSVPLGGNSITQAMSDNLGKSFMQSESLKRDYFSDSARIEKLMAAGDAEDPVAGLLKNSIRNVSKRLAMEIKRSILTYKRSGDLGTPKTLYLSGRAAVTPGLAEYLSEELQVDVKYLDVLSNVSVSPRVNQDVLRENSAVLTELVGAAVKMMRSDAVGVNLLPKSIASDQAFKVKMPALLLFAALLVAAAVPPFISLKESTAAHKKPIVEFSNKTDISNQRLADFNKNKETIAALQSRIEDLESLAKSKSNWIKLFADIENRLFEAKDVWLDDLKVIRSKTNNKTDYRLQLSGRMLIRDTSASATDVTLAIQRVKDLLDSFKQSEFIKDYASVSTDDTNPRILKFNFTLVVNPDKPI